MVNGQCRVIPLFKYFLFCSMLARLGYTASLKLLLQVKVYSALYDFGSEYKLIIINKVIIKFNLHILFYLSVRSQQFKKLSTLLYNTAFLSLSRLLSLLSYTKNTAVHFHGEFTLYIFREH